MRPQLFSVKLPQVSKYKLKQQLRQTKPKDKKTLYFLYSEFLLRANRNPGYKQTLNRADYLAIDGKGLHWSMWKVMQKDFLPKIYTQNIVYWPGFLRQPIFILFAFLQLIWNMFLGAFTLITKYNFTSKTKNQVILGRDFVYDLLKMAEEEKWKTVIIGGSSQSDEVTKNLTTRLFPDLNLNFWTRESTSLLMRDQADITGSNRILDSKNICQQFPDLLEAKSFISQSRPDLLLICLGGASGKQEFFIDHLAQDPDVEFGLATGLGAGLDHLGAGAKQTIAPNWMIKSGLEWLHRLINQPYRRWRIVDSILTLWWWTTAQEFHSTGIYRPTVINFLKKQNTDEYLIVRRRNVLPGDTAWSFVQGGINPQESIEKAGIRELSEEVRLNPGDCQIYRKPVKIGTENNTISWIRFLVQGGKYEGVQKFANFVEYSGIRIPITNWENGEAKWVQAQDLELYLSPEKYKDWQVVQKILAG